MADKRPASHFVPKTNHQFKKPRLDVSVLQLSQKTKQSGPGTSRSYASTKDNKGIVIGELLVCFSFV